MSEHPTTDTHGADAPTAPSGAVRALDRLVGTWTLTGGATGTVTYAWMPGGWFLLQHVELEQYGMQVRGMEVIGALRPFGEAPSDDVHSRFYDDSGNTFDYVYVYEIVGDTLHIWAGERGSPAAFTGTFRAGDRVVDGDWVYPGGGGYQSTMTRVTG